MDSFKPNPLYPIEVFDNILSNDNINQIYNFLANSYYTITNSDRGHDSIDTPFLKLSNRFFYQGKPHSNWGGISQIMLDSISTFFDPILLTNCLPSLNMQVNVSDPSTVDKSHEDFSNGLKGYTILYFANKKWDIDYGGETLFYNNDKEIISAIKPNPGRFVIFDGNLLHSARPPQRHCSYNRYTIAVKFRTDLLDS